MQWREAIGAWAVRYGEAAQARLADVTCAEVTPTLVNQNGPDLDRYFMIQSAAKDIDPCADAWEASCRAAAISGGARCHDTPAAEAQNITAAISIHAGMSYSLLQSDVVTTITVLTVVISM